MPIGTDSAGTHVVPVALRAEAAGARAVARFAGTRLPVALVAGLALAAGRATAQQTPPPGPPEADSLRTTLLEPIVAEGRIDDLRGIAASASEGSIGFRDFRLRPLLREGELLETVPGVILTQHSGDGKANQMFARGFNLDHGTDFATSVEGIPINLPTHAHGQGYTDLNFLIPEFVDHVDYRMGTYHAELGDFSAAGGAAFHLRDELPGPLVSLTVGEHGFQRLVAGSSREVGPGTLLVGFEAKGYDGPWEVPQDLAKRSGLARYTVRRGSDALSLLAMGYANSWNASDQIPLRLVEDGTISRFGQVDESLGGETHRVSLSAHWSREALGSATRVEAYGVHYGLDLFSNFTYALDDETNGDQFEQHDDGRVVLGGNVVHVRQVGRNALRGGLQTRFDRFDVALHRTAERERLFTVRADQGHQWSTGLFLESETRWSDRLRTVVGVRGDYYRYRVESDLPANSGSTSDFIVSPKASAVLTVLGNTELYLSAGYGFHGNDARGTVQTVDPVTLDPVDPVDPLVPAFGAEVGFRASPTADWRATVALWTVKLDSELLYVGDAGTTEASDPSRRVGLTLTNTVRLTPELTGEMDFSLARARFLDVAEGEDRIPGAIESILSGGVTWDPAGDGPYAAVRLRQMGKYPLLEDGSVRAPRTTLLNLNGGWSHGRFRVGAAVLNLLDSKDSDIRYFYESRVTGEVGPVEDVHVHPVEPRQIRFTVSMGM